MIVVGPDGRAGEKPLQIVKEVASSSRFVKSDDENMISVTWLQCYDQKKMRTTHVILLRKSKKKKRASLSLSVRLVLSAKTFDLKTDKEPIKSNF